MTSSAAAIDASLAAIAPELERSVARFVVERRLAGAAVGLVVDDRLAWSHGAGVADQETGRPMDARTVFRIASISKLFTATAIVRLRDQGRLRLDDPAVQYLPELAGAHNPFGPIDEVTIDRLLRHTSGLDRGPVMPDGVRAFAWELGTHAAALADPQRIRVLSRPGSRWRYSNLGFGLLAIIAERLTGRPHAETVRETITGPLGMDATGPHPAGEVAARCATGYDRNAFSDRLTPTRSVDSGWFTGSGELWSTVEDLARFASAQLVPYGAPAAAADLLAPASLREMHRQTVLADEGWTTSWGLGWVGVRRGDLVTVGHSGKLPGFMSGLSLCLRERVGAIVLLNGCIGGNARDLGGTLLELALPVITAERDARQAVPVALPVPPDVRPLLGSYLDDDGDRVHVVWRGGHLCLLPVPSGPTDAWPRLEATDDPLHFIARDEEGREDAAIRFVRDGAGRVELLTYGGYPYWHELTGMPS